MTWATLDRDERIAAVRDGAAKGMTAAKLARQLKTGFWAIAAVANENDIALSDVVGQPQASGHDDARPPAGSVVDSDNAGGRHEVEQQTFRQSEAGEAGLHRPSEDPASIFFALDHDSARMLAEMATKVGRSPSAVARSLVEAVLLDDARAHGKHERAA